MNRVDGIAETISDYLTEKGIDIPSEELQQLSKDIDYGCSMYDEVAYGHIPNPMIAEVQRVQKLRKDDDMQHGREVERLRELIEELKRECRRLEGKIQDMYSRGFSYE